MSAANTLPAREKDTFVLIVAQKGRKMNTTIEYLLKQLEILAKAKARLTAREETIRNRLTVILMEEAAKRE